MERRPHPGGQGSRTLGTRKPGVVAQGWVTVVPLSAGTGLPPRFYKLLLATMSNSLLFWHAGALPLCPDFVPQDKIGDEAQGDEENAQDNEVQVEFGVLHVQLSQNGL